MTVRASVVATGLIAVSLALPGSGSALQRFAPVGPASAPHVGPQAGSQHFFPAASPAGAPAARLLPEATAVRLERTLQQPRRTRRWEGAAIGFVTGAIATHLILYSGGSTSLCDRERNQDAMRRRECTALVAAGGVLGAGAGYLVGSRIRTTR